MLGERSKIFGSVARTKVLVGLALLNESYPRELARLLGIPLMSVQRAVDDFDKEGVTASRKLGIQRQVRLNPRYFALAQLRDFLLRLSDAFPAERRAIEQERRRPRRTGKSL